MNPARNAYEIVRTNKLTACKRCGETNLAWVQLKSGKWALVGTCNERPVYRGDNQTPEAPNGYVYANKLKFHRCGESKCIALHGELEEMKRQAYAALIAEGGFSPERIQKIESVFRHAGKLLLEVIS